MFSAEPLSCDVSVDELSNSPDNNKGAWYIDNNGGIIWDGESGVPDADADICDCWNEGLTGTGIKIGDIDFYGFQLSHPDFVGADIPYIYNAAALGAGNASNNGVETSDYYYNPPNNLSHAMLVAGIIMAQPNNISGVNGYAVGAAYDATYHPYLVGIAVAGNSANSAIIRAIHRATKDKCDVLNMSLQLAAPGTISGQLYYAVINGRPDPNNPSNKRGMVVTASVGNTNDNASNAMHFPGNQSETIGVGWSTPEDYRATSTSNGQEGNFSWGVTTGNGSVYGELPYHFDVVAPGVAMRSTNYTFGTGNGYMIVNGSSVASPLVASIAALILEKRPDLTYQQVKQVIRDGAKKVHSSTNGGPYNYINGYSKKMFYGRVSCINSLNIAKNLGVHENKSIISATVKNMGNGKYIIVTPNYTSKDIRLYSLNGKILFEKIMRNDIKETKVDLSRFAKGIYILKIYSNSGKQFTTKLIR